MKLKKIKKNGYIFTPVNIPIKGRSLGMVFKVRRSFFRFVLDLLKIK